jgi:hypothetical protein
MTHGVGTKGSRALGLSDVLSFLPKYMIHPIYVHQFSNKIVLFSLQYLKTAKNGVSNG